MRTLLLAAALLFGPALSADLCPPEDLIEPCDCISGYKPVTYRCTSVLSQDTVEGVFRRSLDYPLHAVIFAYSSLLYVNGSLMNQKSIDTLAIYHSRFNTPLSSIPDENNHMQNLILKNSTFLKGVDWRLFQHMSLVIVQIEEVTLKAIGRPFVDSLKPTLTQLTLEKARIQKLHDEAFSKLPALRVLSCAYNSIKTVKRSMFARETALYLLDFSHNKIDRLPDDIFSDMPHLQTVYFGDNQLKTFSLPVWGEVFDHLDMIDLDGNQIVCDCKVKWYTTRSRGVPVRGTCDTPRNMKGWNLNQLSQGDFHYCSK